MPDYPYSDNMYSGLEDSDVEEQSLEHPNQTVSGPVDGDTRSDVGDAGNAYSHNQQEEEEALSPTDGYFGRSGSGPPSAYPDDVYSPSSLRDREGDVRAASASPSTSGYAAATSSQVPHVPDIWVPDPSIGQGSTAESKAREAQQERELNANNANNSRAGQHAAINNPSSLPAAVTSSHVRGGGSYPASSDQHSQSSTSASGIPRYGFGPGLSSAAPPTQRYTPSSSTAPLSRPQRSGTAYSERSSLFSEAPPAYTPSPTSPTSASTNYQTFSPSNNMGRISESETQGLLAGQRNRSPQDMGGDPEQQYLYTRARDYRDRVRNCRPHPTGRTCKLLVLGLVLIFVTVGFLVSSVHSIKDGKTIHIPGGHGGSGSSPIGKMPDKDTDGTRLAYPAFDGELAWSESQLCDAKRIVTTEHFNLDFSSTHSVSVVQNYQKDRAHNGQNVRVSGDVVVRRAGKGTPGPSITLEIVTSDENIGVDIHWQHSEERLTILTPRAVSRPSDRDTFPCVQIRVTVWTPPGSVLDSLNVETVHLGVKLLDNLSLRLEGAVQIHTTVGTVVAGADGERDAKQLLRDGGGAPPPTFDLDSRHIEVKTVSHTIAGTWPLYDYLGLETVSGSIRAGVAPKEALREKPVPAVLYVHTTSGTIEVYEPIAEATTTRRDAIPARQYDVDLYTMSGTVRGSLAFGTSCRVHTTSGNIDLALLPVLDASQIASAGPGGRSVLETATTSGTTVINVLDALWRDVRTGEYAVGPDWREEQEREQGRQRGRDGEAGEDMDPITGALESIIDTVDKIAREVLDGVWRDVIQTGSHPAHMAPTTPQDLPQQPQREDEAEASSPGSRSKTSPSSSSSPPALRALDSRHVTTSASIRLTYPSTWEGTIEADTLTGGLDVSGRGVEVIRRDEGFPGYKKHLVARKGEDGAGGGDLKVHTTSGSIAVAVGSS
ncbi:hypothetical protein VPNG_09439 [Cytospora leucostoma]|uniref:Adhesin domain-containing protein n=1 Tax=Cytospora leucostoma TaxID=1230097 RepID=A0A423VPR7_9PEZI|nr:hypothetical protein VPNG_09439 [Cytospora leucostoma]